jgi:predicted O-linked N-acetylglucosamine transferase (SPINDLY family)
MVTTAEALTIALGHHQAGRLQAAEQIYRQILAVEPNHPDALHLLGLIAHQVGRPDVAVEYLEAAVRVLGTSALVHYNLGEVYRALGRASDAMACYQRATQLQPAFAEAHFNWGNVLRALGELAAARDCYQRALHVRPDFVEAHYNLGNTLTAQGDLAGACACYRRALQLQPDHALACNNLGNALRLQGQLAEAVACFRRSSQLQPDNAGVYNNLGNAFKDQGELDEAVASFGRALQLQPNYAEAHCNLGTALKDQGRLREALACYERALQLRPAFVQAHSNLVYALQFSPDCDAQALLEEHCRWDRQHAEPLRRSIPPHANDPTPDRRLRVGYVSPDFRDHCQALFMVPLLSCHDHRDVEVFCYADVACPDGVTARLRASADVWRNTAGLADEQVAQLIRADRIDVLVDLTMHMANNRLLLFARKPAPVQVSWLAYPGTSGLAAIDYRLTDPYLDPPGSGDRPYTETSVPLPDTFWCYDPLSDEPAVNALPAGETGLLTFGCLNNFCKVNAPVLQLWARVLRDVEGSQLLLLAPQGPHREDTLGLLRQEGVASGRVTFVEHRPRQQYLELYHRIDIGLDTLPYNGHTTSLDALWMGVPVVTLVGRTVVGRAGLSQLSNLGLPELIADAPEQFVRVAVELAGDRPRLSKLRSTLRARMRQSPLMDAPRFARNVEAAYRAMWQRWVKDKGKEAGAFRAAVSP